MAKPGPETKLVAKMRKAGKEKYGPGFVSVKYHGSQYGEAGVSDLFCCLHGVFVAVEVKAPESYGGSVEKALEKGPTPNQLEFGRRIEAADGIFDVCATVDQFLDVLALAAAVASKL